jgi:hypothetical protein
MGCEFAHYDGAYVLGALSAGERAAYQAHLAGCAECTRAVQELAGLPGLLARVPVDVLESPATEPVPDTLLPALLRQAERTSRRRRAWVAIGMAAAVTVIAGGSLAIGTALGNGNDPIARPSTGETTTLPAGQTMVPVSGDSMSASLALTGVAWGTRLDLTCSYRSSDSWGEEEVSSYAMFVRTRDGKVEQVATWRALPGKTMRLAAATAANRDDITSVEIRTAGGRTVLKLLA